MNSFFEGLKDDEITELLKSAREETVPDGTVVLREGDSGVGVYILKSGRVEIRKRIEDKEEVLYTVEPGKFFGEMSTLDGKAISASAVAAEESTVLSIDNKSITSLARRFPKISWNIAKELSERLRASNEALKDQIEIRRSAAQKEITRLNSLIEATQTVNTSLEIDRVLHLILHEAMRITSVERGTIYLVDENTNEIWSRTIVGDEITEIRQPIGKGISGYVAMTGETVNIQDAYHDTRFNPEFDKKTGFRTKNILCMPMRNKDDKIIGVFQLINKKHGEVDFDAEDEKFLKAFSIHASIAIEKSRMAQEMVKSERLSAVGRMAGTIIHDIKNPMATIRVYAQVLKKKAENEEASNLVDEITKQIDRLVNMAQEVLDFSRGVSQINIQKVNFNEFLSGVLWFLQKDFEKRSIELVNQSEYDGEIEIDVDKMTRVILNIAGNAVDAMPNGGKFSVRSHSEQESLVIELEDTGSGMPDEIRKKIFEPFVTYGKKHGTGLGMAIVKKIVDDHNGEIEIESETGKGTKMILRLPISQGERR